MAAGRVVDGMLRLLDGLDSVVAIDAGSCTRTQGSACVACVESCPKNALADDGEGRVPAMDPAACIGCGICVPVCPTGATSGVGIAPARIVAAAVAAQDRLEIRCGAARSAALLARPDVWALDVFCLAAVHAETVAATAARLDPGGVLTLVRSDCAVCPAGAGRQVEEVTAHGMALAAHVADDRTVEVAVEVEVVEQATSATSATSATEHHPSGRRDSGHRDQARDALAMNRRDLLRGFTGGRRRPPAERPEHANADTDAPESPAMATAALSLPRAALLAAAPHAPMPRPFAEPGCTACEACSSVCPTGALTWSVSSSAATLAVDEQACLACGECVRVCPEDVLSLGCTLPGRSDPASDPATVASVRVASCERCGAELHPGEVGSCTRCASRRSILDDVWSQYD